MYKMPDSNLVGFEEENPPDIKISDFFEDIRRHCSDLQMGDIKFLYHGTYNVFLIKKTYILRIPDQALRNQEGLNLLKQESAKLKFFNDQWPKSLRFTIPKPLYINEDQKLPYFYYKMIRGQSLNNVYNTLTQSLQIKVAHQTAQFLDFLHSFELAQQFKARFPHLAEHSPEKYFTHWKEKYNMVKSLIFPILKNEQEKTWLSNLFESFLDHPEYCKFSPVISHGDFDISNILVSENPLKITGIIDFEETKIGDPAADYLFYREGTQFMQELFKSRQINYDLYIKNRMKFLFCRTCIPYIEWGIDHNRLKMVEYGKDRIKMLMNLFPESNCSKLNELNL